MKKPMPAPSLTDLLNRLEVSEKIPLLLTVEPLPRGEYLHWDELRYRTPPDGLSVEEWWLGIKLGRSRLLKEIPLKDRTGATFKYGMPDPVLEMVHVIDRDASGHIQLDEQVTNPATRDRYIVRSLIEEAITSSQLEGASTTTSVAKQMIRTGRAPLDRGEQMIFNNYHAMKSVVEMQKEPLTIDHLLELHRTLTEHTMDDPSDAGRFRVEEDRVLVTSPTDELLFVPPPADELGVRLAGFLEFANGESGAGFIHPVIRSVLVHFWFAHDHPFVDGNGRTARALFYWSMLRSGYWLAEFLSISRVLRAAPSRYARSFLYTESDENDLTYFLLLHLRAIRQAIQQLQAYIKRKSREIRLIESSLRETKSLNHRQIALLSHALRHPGYRYTIRSHQNANRVVYQTARTDLLGLESARLLQKRRVGRHYYFFVPDDLLERLSTDRPITAGGPGRGGRRPP